MKIVTCDECGSRFAIGHDLDCQDPELAIQQAVWLQDKFVWDHIQEQKHQGSIRLPELKGAARAATAL